MISLEDVLAALGSVVVAYSGGVDSSYLAFEANRVLGTAALAVTADSPSMPRDELEDAIALARDLGLRHEVVRTSELGREAYVANAPDRCFHCKEALFDEVFPLAVSRGIANVAIGTVTDDLGDIRPGLASARRRGARQPLLEAGLSKADVRVRAREAGLRVWDKPAAACLSSRIAHGTRVTTDVLARIESAEASIHAMGLDVVRVRDDGTGAARVELTRDVLAHLDGRQRDDILAAVLAAGYREAVIDPRGYRTGGANLPILPS